MPRIFCVERPPRGFRPVERRRLLGSVIAEADRHHFPPVCSAKVERVGGPRVARFSFLQLEDLNDCFLHGREHLGEGVSGLPGFLGAVLGQVGHV